MGYTHDWRIYRPIDAETFRMIRDDIARIIRSAKIALGNESGVGRPVLADDCIAFNGSKRAGEDCESFVLLLGDDGPDFCKTNRNPYDLVVTAALIVMKHHHGDSIRVSSDGEPEEWQPSRDLCQSVLGYGADFEIEAYESYYH
jgi:hypothetical protein